MEPQRSGSRALVGLMGEAEALETYRRAGFRVLARNWRCPAGELDLVLARDGLLVFCEVKTRTGSILGGGHEAVTRRKRLKVRRLAELFIAARSPTFEAVRFDVASVQIRGAGRPSVELFEDAF